MIFLRSLLLSCFLALPFMVGASGPAPDVLIRTMTDEVLHVLKTDEGIKNGDPSRAVQLVEEIVLPHFNLRRMTMLAVGRDWRDASPEQQERLVNAFYSMLLRTYSTALTLYSDQSFDYRPLRMSPGDRSARVQTFFRQSGAQPVSVDYMLAETPEGWQVFDVVIAGVSLVTNYRSSFAREIAAGGIDGLIRSLEGGALDGEA